MPKLKSFPSYTLDELKILRSLIQEDYKYCHTLDHICERPEDFNRRMLPSIFSLDADFRYVMTIPLIDVPLFINENDDHRYDHIIARWRLQLGK